MKTICSILSSLILILCASCSQQLNDEPQVGFAVEFAVELEGVTILQDTVYAVKGETVKFASVISTPLTVDVTFRDALFFVDGKVIPTKIDSKPAFRCDDVTAAPGHHTLSIAATMQREDMSQFGMALNLPIVVVDSDCGIPDLAPEIGTHTFTLKCHK